MKILFSYSFDHFDPKKDPAEHAHWHSSASILSRTLFDVLREVGEVTYIDRKDYSSVIGKEFDLFVGIAENFHAICKHCRIKKSVFLAVNMHPRERNRVLKKAWRKLGLPKSAFAHWEFHRPRKIERSLRTADHILCVGNDTTVQSYVKHGVPRSKIRRVNYGVLRDTQAQQSGPRGAEHERPCHFIYVASEIGLRKGFDIVADVSSNALATKTPFLLNIVGKPSTPYHEQKLKDLVDRSNGQIRFHGWIDSASESYWRLVESADFVIFPTLEEGQAGTVLDCISAGVIPLVSENAGFDFSPLGHLTVCSTNNRSVFQTACGLPLVERERLREQTLRYYRDFHQQFKTSFTHAFNDILRGQTLPLISVVLPIHNKRRSIIELLIWLDATLREYGNAELHLFFDGCTDGTETVVTEYFRKPRGYLVTFETTPNLFEVKTNNLGLKKASGEIVAILQDDNYIYDKCCFFHAADLFNVNHTLAVLGGLAGVNFFPRGTVGLSGNGQIACNDNEVYWRQDSTTDPSLARRVFEVDACMRGPLFLRRSHAENLGFLDEVYAPLYQDDMDLCFRARAKGYQVFCSMMDVENRSLTMAHYDSKKNEFFTEIIRRNTDIFYARHSPSAKKSDFWIDKPYVPKRTSGWSSIRARYEQLKDRVHRFRARIRRKMCAHTARVASEGRGPSTPRCGN